MKRNSLGWWLAAIQVLIVLRGGCRRFVGRHRPAGAPGRQPAARAGAARRRRCPRRAAPRRRRRALLCARAGRTPHAAAAAAASATSQTCRPSCSGSAAPPAWMPARCSQDEPCWPPPAPPCRGRRCARPSPSRASASWSRRPGRPQACLGATRHRCRMRARGRAGDRRAGAQRCLRAASSATQDGVKIRLRSYRDFNSAPGG